ncbi:hypothetical protein A9Z05_02605 [Burkholderia sp. A2]|nr:hypothetical protein A9Z05_02605 [Burkholderia sp. A2]
MQFEPCLRLLKSNSFLFFGAARIVVEVDHTVSMLPNLIESISCALTQPLAQSATKSLAGVVEAHRHEITGQILLPVRVLVRDYQRPMIDYERSFQKYFNGGVKVDD